MKNKMKGKVFTAQEVQSLLDKMAIEAVKRDNLKKDISTILLNGCYFSDLEMAYSKHYGRVIDLRTDFGRNSYNLLNGYRTCAYDNFLQEYKFLLNLEELSEALTRAAYLNLDKEPRFEELEYLLNSAVTSREEKIFAYKKEINKCNLGIYER